MCPIFGFEVFNFNSSDWSPTSLYGRLIAQAKFTFFLTNNSTLPEVQQSIPALEGILAAFESIIVLAKEMRRAFIFTQFVISSTIIWIACKSFIRSIPLPGSYPDEGHPRKTSDNLVESYQELERISNSINSVWSFMCFWLILDVTLWLATDLDHALKTTDWFVKVHMTYFIVYFGWTFILSANTAREMTKFKHWLAHQKLACWKNRDETAATTYQMLLDQVEQSCICVGALGFYKIDFSFICQVDNKYFSTY